jgi:hypothetical protein
MNARRTGFYTCKKCHKTESLQNHTATVHREREQLGDRKKLARAAVTGDGTGQMVQTLRCIIIIIIIIIIDHFRFMKIFRNKFEITGKLF